VEFDTGQSCRVARLHNARRLLRAGEIITGHKDRLRPTTMRPGFWPVPSLLEDFDKQWPGPARRTSLDAMMAKYAAYGNPYTLFAAAASQF